MGMRYRKSIKIGGIRVNVNKKSIGVSAGVPGLRQSVNTKGQRRTTVSAPGTGLSYVSQSSSKKHATTSTRSQTPSQRATAPPARTLKPGLFAPKAEKRLFKYLSLAREDVARDNWVPGMEAMASDPALGFAASTILGCLLARLDRGAAQPYLEATFATGYEPASDPFLAKYFSPYIEATLQVLPTIGETAMLSRRMLGLMLIPIYQAADNDDAIVSVTDALEPSPILTIIRSNCILDTTPERVAQDTEGVTNQDDTTALLVVLRGAAMRRLGYETAALEQFKEALRYPSRAAAVRHRARYERARLHLDANRPKQARADLERILADDIDFMDVQELLSQLP
jgi:tetratricopeptide (TPR) repeat protein